ncbi:CD82 antigen [Rhinatrema bivittatum]|uniref:CD82 antigen n=1 Tax=Rhinatrema bivittatum TaxID=194408 RepID=UPI00112CAE85|nr:CD82 antigen [Rhinatrema bivittatum]XP_029438047.1 CD82 antigen [Rhinatrema bivittatum]
MATGCMKVTKYFLFLFNLLFFILGALILGFGIWILVDNTSFIAVLQSSSASLKVASYILITVGAITMLMGFLGCVGAVNEIRCLLGLYCACLLLILIAQVTAGVLIYFQRDKLKTELSVVIEDLIENYDYMDGKNTSTEETWDYVQKQLKCCGWTNFSDWNHNKIISNSSGSLYSCSCNANTSDTNGFCMKPSNTTVELLYTKGCMEGVQSWLQDNIGIILGICVGVAVIEVFGMVLSVCLCRNIHSEEYSKVPKY